MRIATWNINSVRLRQKQVVQFLESHQPDILCLQETKTPDEAFPFKPFRKAGYEHIHIHGMKGYNGLAILSRRPFTDTQIHHRCGREDCRHIKAIFRPEGMDRPLHVNCLYIPAGGDEPDPKLNDKFAHKLTFVDEMTDWFAATYSAKEDAVIALGDFNIAPYEHDVWSHKQLLNVVSHTPIEVEKLEAMRAALDWTDTARYFISMDEKLYSWWSYRARDWQKSNRGRRLDHIWTSPVLKPYLKGYETYTEPRSWEKPSDHVPILLDLKF